MKKITFDRVQKNNNTDYTDWRSSRNSFEPKLLNSQCPYCVNNMFHKVPCSSGCSYIIMFHPSIVYVDHGRNQDF